MGQSRADANREAVNGEGASGSVDVLPVPESSENDFRLFDCINAAVVPHPQTPGIRRPGQEPNIAPRPAAPGISPEEFKGG